MRVLLLRGSVPRGLPRAARRSGRGTSGSLGHGVPRGNWYGAANRYVPVLGARHWPFVALRVLRGLRETGRAMFGMLSSLAELQRKLIVANTNDGLASARARGRVGGRRPKLTEDQAALAQRLYDEREKTVQQIADMLGVPRSTVYGHLDKAKTVPRQPKTTMVKNL